MPIREFFRKLFAPSGEFGKSEAALTKREIIEAEFLSEDPELLEAFKAVIAAEDSAAREDFYEEAGLGKTALGRETNLGTQPARPSTTR